MTKLIKKFKKGLTPNFSKISKNKKLQFILPTNIALTW